MKGNNLFQLGNQNDEISINFFLSYSINVNNLVAIHRDCVGKVFVSLFY